MIGDEGRRQKLLPSWRSPRTQPPTSKSVESKRLKTLLPQMRLIARVAELELALKANRCWRLHDCGCADYNQKTGMSHLSAFYRA